MSDNSSVHREAFWMLVGERIGYGMSRAVYECKLRPDCVVKVEDAQQRFQNIMEWETWQRVKGTEFEKWFAPCEWISPAGVVLVMKFTNPLRKQEYPEKMPAFLTDFKRSNYGMYNGRVVCHDYGTHLMLENGMTKRMQKVDWWEE